ncbi:hypothetical protein RRG08_047607 [Elysia crispata]|uniref:Uncharacterized protein n=1 Tax=Elysia crispata TaxID=231223 RepID=A0AAE1BDU4_9GAST|nr:hypothetical protein RRG08_047607 [Elysia crispata]
MLEQHLTSPLASTLHQVSRNSRAESMTPAAWPIYVLFGHWGATRSGAPQGRDGREMERRWEDRLGSSSLDPSDPGIHGRFLSSPASSDGRLAEDRRVSSHTLHLQLGYCFSLFYTKME